MAASPQAVLTQPIVQILSPADGAEFSDNEMVVQVSVQLPEGQTLIALRALIDGRIAGQTRGLKLPTPAPGDSKERKLANSVTVSLPSQDCILTVLAEATQSKSQPVSVHLKWRGTLSTPEQLAAHQPKLYVLAIGVSEYQQPELSLRFAAKDARDLAAAFRSQQKILYRAIETKVLTDKQATKNNILDGLEWLQRQTTAKDVAVLFLAGHGITDPSSGSYYFLPHEADAEAIKRTMLPEAEIRGTLSAIAGKVLLFLDSCHSGKVFGSTQTRGVGDFSPFISELASSDSGVVVFAASTGRQSSQEAPEWSNGAFTKALIEGLSGRADFRKSGRITLNMLDLYISERVKELTRGKQTPTTAKPSTIPDFPIAISRELSNEDVDLAR